MNESKNPAGENTEIQNRYLIDQLCDAFEEDWQEGRRPELNEYLSRVPSHLRHSLLIELINLDWDWLKRIGDEVDLDTYISRFPEDVDTIREQFKKFHSSGNQFTNAGTLDVSREQLDQETNDTQKYPFSQSNSELASPVSGSIIGGYEILESIGKGGMGVVYRARQVNLRRIVALKMIKPGEFDDPAYIKRFQAEASAAAQLDHPGIVQVYDVGEDAGRHYFSMAYVDGPNLAQLVAERPLTNRKAAVITKAITEAIAVAHAHGLIHRDLKPANVLMEVNGQPKITDFGLAKSIKTESDLTATGQILGTPSYMPPEQATGSISDVAEPADIYSIGAILYCLLTGNPPFQSANPFDTLKQVQEQEPVPPRQLNPQISPDLETICLKCLEKDPAHRYLSAYELGQDLSRYINGEPIVARPVGLSGRTWRWCKRQPVVASLLGTVAFTVMLGSIASTVFAIQASEQADQARQNLKQVDIQRQRAEGNAQLAKERELAAKESEAKAITNAKRADEKTQEAVANLNRANMLRRVGDEARQQAERLLYTHQLSLAQQVANLDKFNEAYEFLESTNESLRGWEYRYLSRLAGGAQIHIDLRSWPQSVDFSPDGKRFVCAQMDEAIIYDSASGVALKHFRPVRQSAQEKSYFRQARYSSDGKTIITSDYRGVIQIWDSQTGENKSSGARQMPSVTGVFSMSPNGQEIAHATQDRRVVLWDHASEKQVGNLVGIPEGNIDSISFSSDGRYLAATASQNASGYLCIWKLSHSNADQGTTDPIKPLEVINKPDSLAHLTGINFLPESSLCFLAYNPRQLGKLEEAQDFPPLFLQQDGTSVRIAAVSADGAYVALADSHHRIHVWEMKSETLLGTFKGHSDVIKDLDFSSDGKSLVSCSESRRNSGFGGEIRVWLLESLQERPAHVRIEKHRGNSRGVVSPDTRLIAILKHEQKATHISISNYNDGEILATITGPRNGPYEMCFSPDSSKIASAISGTLQVHDVRTGEVVVELENSEGCNAGISFSSDGQFITGAADKQVKLWNAQTGKFIRHFEGMLSTPQSVKFDSRAKRICATATNTVHLWDVESGQKIHLLVAQPVNSQRLTCLAWSPDDRWIAASGKDSFLIWDAEKGKLHRYQWSHDGTVYSIAFSPDGSRIVTGGSNGVVNLWTLTGQHPVLSLSDLSNEVDSARSNGVKSVSFSSDGRTVTSVDFYCVINSWNCGSHPHQQIGADIATQSDSEAVYSRTINDASHQIVNNLGMKLVLIPSGEFIMGSSFDDELSRDNEHPQHYVRITQPFYLGAHEVTRGQFMAVMGEDPSPRFDNQGDDRSLSKIPVTSVTWYEAIDFCNKLSEQEGRQPYYRRLDDSRVSIIGGNGYRLPMEAQWEFACRAGTSTRFHFGENPEDVDEYEWYKGNVVPPRRGPQPVGTKKPNPWGLFDMGGNVAEWCWDDSDYLYYHYSARINPVCQRENPFRVVKVIRGGNWFFNSNYSRSASRGGSITSEDKRGSLMNIGFRVLLPAR